MQKSPNNEPNLILLVHQLAVRLALSPQPERAIRETLGVIRRKFDAINAEAKAYAKALDGRTDVNSESTQA